MFVGHAALAFAVVARLAATRLRRREALTLGLVAGAFATIPDVDMLYAPVGLVGARLDALALASAFWSASTLVHRGVTHSLVVSAAVAVVAVAWVVGVRGDRRVAAASAVAGGSLVAGVTLDAGTLAGGVTLLFVASGLFVAGVVARRTTLSTASVAAAAAVGLLSHPFGDVLTGTPPAFLYPFETTLLAERVALAADPTLHLLAAFAVELLAVWLAALVLVGGSGRERLRHLRGLVRPRVAVAAVYATTVFVIPPPTLDYSFPFVFSVVAVGAVGAIPRVHVGGRRRVTVPDRLSAILTALSAVSVAWAAYVVAYVVV
jgi:membrane-bound metal-dependent hydrolase YbcI (DUF457 family)